MSKRSKWIIAVVVGLVALGVGVACFGWRMYRDRFVGNTGFAAREKAFFIPSGTSFPELVELLQRDTLVANAASFRRFAISRGGESKVYSGRYIIAHGMTNAAIYNRIAGRMQTAVRLVVPTTRTKEEFAGRVARQLELDSTDLLTALNDPNEAKRLGFSVETLQSMCLPNTYQVYWDCGVARLLDRLRREWEHYWTSTRDSLAARAGLSRVQVATLASIIQEEVLHASELPRVAGVYMNRLEKGMPLQACPTAKFAAGDLGIKRVLIRHTQIESPYNTYIHPGLPPGPIRFPSLAAMDAVLNYEAHGYLYFCAKADFSGYHNFSRTGLQHARYAREYQRELNRRHIR